MAWVELTEDAVKSSAGLTAVELNTVRTLLVPSGVSDTLADVLTGVAQEIRGYVAASHQVALGDGLTIPGELLRAALARVVYELSVRIPGKVVLTAQREAANTAAVRLLENTAAGKFTVVGPATEAPAAEQPSGTAVVLVNSRNRRATRDQLDRL